MQPKRRPRIKICCISTIDEAQLAIEAGASALGLVSAMPSGPGVIGEDLIAEIAKIVPPGVASFLLTSKQSVAEIIEQHRRLRTNTIQICDRVVEGSYSALRDALPGIKLVQVVHVAGEESIDEAVAVSQNVDAILLDSGNQNLTIKELGGTGRRHNWSISRRIRDAINVPMYLAGGINAGNVQQAIREVGPFGIDLCSSVRTNGWLDDEKLRAFFDAVRS